MTCAVADELQPICAALGISLTERQSVALLAYVDLLQRWNGTYNLTAVRHRADVLTQHLADCLALIPALRRHGLPARLLDVGSGGGLPGVVIAALLPDTVVVCVDSVVKKVAFLRQVAGALPLPNLHALHTRVEAMHVQAFEVVVCRAFAALPDFVALTRQHLQPGGVWLAMKGRVPSGEIASLPPEVDVFHVEHLSVPGLTAERCLVWMRPAP